MAGAGAGGGGADTKDVPMKLGDFSVLDTEFGNMRERFDQEMKRMEEEMNKFRSELLDKDSSKLFHKSGRWVIITMSHENASRLRAHHLCNRGWDTVLPIS